MSRTSLYLFVLVFTCIQGKALAQSMTRSTGLLNRIVQLGQREYGSGISFYDVNQDGLDDITIPRTNNEVLLFLSDGEEFHDVELMHVKGEAKMPCWADYDNDGDPDLFITSWQDSCKLYRNDGDLNFVDVSYEVGLDVCQGLESYGATWGDYDNDGWLDLFIANYDAGTVNGNWLFKNNQGQSFTDVSTQMGVGIGCDYSFIGTFIDIDFDGDLDLHVANDRFPIDAHFVNEGDYFFNNAAGSGLDIYSNSMSSSFADFDKDGDFDFYVTNTADLGNDLWQRNDDGTYTNIAQEKNMEMFRFSWGALWIDIDNDSWEDLYVNNQAAVGDVPPFFLNQSGDFVHQDVTNEGYRIWGYAAGKGDFNDDGFYDFVVNGHNGYKCEFFKNNGGENHWLKFDLEGTASNRDGIGTLIEYWIDGVKNIRFTRAGDGFLTQDSQWQILGLGDNAQVDTLALHWPSGMVETFYNIPSNQNLHFIEGQTASLSLIDGQGEPFVFNQYIMCEGDVFTLEASPFDSYLWSTGETSAAINITQEGTYQVTAYNEFGVPYTSQQVTVSFVPEPNLTYNTVSPVCIGESNGEILWQNVPEGWVNSWSDPASPEWEINNLSAGLFSGILTNVEWGCTAYVEAWLYEPMALNAGINAIHPSCFELDNGFIEVESSWGGTGQHTYVLWIDNTPFEPNENFAWENLYAGNYFIQIRDENACSTMMAVSLSDPEPLVAISNLGENNEVTFEVTGGTPPYIFIDSSVGEQVVPPVNAVPGVHTWWVFDANDCVAEVEATIPTSIMETSQVFDFYCNKNEVHFSGQVPLQFSIYNVAGQLIKSERIQSSSVTVHLAAGSYIGVCTYPNGQTLVKKIILP